MDSIFIFEIDRIYRISWIFFMPGFRLPAIASRSGKAVGYETGYKQSASRKNSSLMSRLFFYSRLADKPWHP
jgi:hypothetical protein